MSMIAAEFVSLDGYVAGPDGEMNWGPDSIDPDDLKPEWDTILLGRVTYQLWLNFWPTTPLGTNPQADFINKAPKVVFSRTLNFSALGEMEQRPGGEGAHPRGNPKAQA